MEVLVGIAVIVFIMVSVFSSAKKKSAASTPTRRDDEFRPIQAGPRPIAPVQTPRPAQQPVPAQATRPAQGSLPVEAPRPIQTAQAASQPIRPAQPATVKVMQPRHPAPQAEKHTHPATKSRVRVEKVPTGGSLEAEYEASQDKEGCDDTRNFRYVLEDQSPQVEKVSPIRMEKEQVLQGVIWSQILAPRGGRSGIR